MKVAGKNMGIQTSMGLSDTGTHVNIIWGTYREELAGVIKANVIIHVRKICIVFVCGAL